MLVSCFASARRCRAVAFEVCISRKGEVVDTLELRRATGLPALGMNADLLMASYQIYTALPSAFKKRLSDKRSYESTGGKTPSNNQAACATVLLLFR